MENVEEITKNGKGRRKMEKMKKERRKMKETINVRGKRTEKSTGGRSRMLNAIDVFI